jgi:hypothetical protein
VLLGTPLQASLSPHLLNVPVQIANKLGLQTKKKKIAYNKDNWYCYFIPQSDAGKTTC